MPDPTPPQHQPFQPSSRFSPLVPDEYHTHSDVNIDANALHHTLGKRAHEAAPGNHGHDFKYSRMLGEIIEYALPGSVPTGWLECDGSILDKTKYSLLAAALGTTYNIGGDAGSVVRLPDTRRRFPRGINVIGDLAITDGKTDPTTRSFVHSHGTGGSSTLTVPNSGGHPHPISAVNHNGLSNTQSTGTGGVDRVTRIAGVLDGSHDHGGSASSTGSGHTHNITGVTDSTVAADFPYIYFRFLIYAAA